MRNKNALIAWSAISAGVQDLLASFFQSLYCTVLNKENPMTYFHFLSSKRTKQLLLLYYRIAISENCTAAVLC